MEYVEGLDLAKMVEVRGPLPVANACNYAHQAALGLQHAREHGMVHRDIKPSNLMLSRQGDRALIKVLDFGLAKVRSEGAVNGGLTHEGQMLGTPDYVAPEQISDARRADIRADIYSLGCTLYYLLTGGPPFQGTSLYDVLQAHHSMHAKLLSLARPEVPVELAALVAKMMAKEPERRFQEPKEVAQALKPFFKSGSVAAVGSKPEVSEAGQTVAREAPGSVSVPTRSATNVAPAPAQVARNPADPAQVGPLWESLIDLREPEAASLEEAKSAVPEVGRGRPPWIWPSVATAVLLLAFLVAWAVVIRIKTKHGDIVLKNVRVQSEVIIDGQEVKVRPPTGGDPTQITVSPGGGGVQVREGETERSGAEVTVEKGGNRGMNVRLDPHVVPRPEEVDQGRLAFHFNGKDLSGWTFPFGNEADWRVENGQLLGIASSEWDHSIATERPDFGDFHLKLEVSSPDVWNKHILFRSTPDPNNDVNYRFQLGGQRTNGEQAPRGDYLIRTWGNLRSGAQLTKDDLECIKPPNGPALATNRWYTIEVIAQDNVFRFIIDGKETSAFRDEKSRLRQGRIEIRLVPSSKISVRKLEISELDRATDALRTGTVWTGEQTRVVEGDSRVQRYPVTFTVRDRNGDRFKARLDTTTNIREIYGTIKSGRISWLARDVKIIKGHQGHDHTGTIQDDEISLKYAGIGVPEGTPVSGTVKLRLEK